VGASSVRPDAKNAILDSDVNFTIGRGRVWYGQEMPPALNVSFSSQVLEQAGSDVVIGILRCLFEIADKYSPISGLVDLARPDDAFAGMVYDAAWPRTAPLNRWIEQIAWVFSGAKKGDRLRGLYWGNYLGPKVLKCLGGRERFFELCVEKARSYDGSPDAICWRFPHGLFVSLCLNPLDCRPGSPFGMDVAAEANLKWLLPELGRAGVLNNW
jgi:hypothetical protein